MASSEKAAVIANEPALACDVQADRPDDRMAELLRKLDAQNGGASPAGAAAACANGSPSQKPERSAAAAGGGVDSSQEAPAADVVVDVNAKDGMMAETLANPAAVQLQRDDDQGDASTSFNGTAELHVQAEAANAAAAAAAAAADAAGGGGDASDGANLKERKEEKKSIWELQGVTGKGAPLAHAESSSDVIANKNTDLRNRDIEQRNEDAQNRAGCSVTNWPFALLAAILCLPLAIPAIYFCRKSHVFMRASRMPDAVWYGKVTRLSAMFSLIISAVLWVIILVVLIANSLQ